MNLMITNVQRKTMNAWQRFIWMTQHLPSSTTAMVKPLHGTKMGIYYDQAAYIFALDPFYHPFQVYWRRVGRDYPRDFESAGVLRQLKQANTYLESQFAEEFEMTQVVPPMSRKQWQCLQLLAKLLQSCRQLDPKHQQPGHRCWVTRHENRLTLMFEQGNRIHPYCIEYNPLVVPLMITWGYQDTLTQQPSLASTIKFLKVMLDKIQSYH